MSLVVGKFDRVSLEFAQTDVPTWLEVVEGQMAQLVQVAERIQTVVDLLANLSLAAGTGLDLAEIRVSDLYFSANIAQTAAVRAVGIAQQVGLVRWCTSFSVR